jgi:hypothetical protein
MVGETSGDLVHWLGILTDRRYQIDVKYDSRGFRNDYEIEQAPIVIIGDSFVEAGLVPQELLLSTHLRSLLQVEVANLGQSAYGPQQELLVLQRYGFTMHPKIVLWLFFEGNDLLDVQRYERFIQNRDTILNEVYSFKDRSFTANAVLLLGGLTGSGSKSDTDEARRRSCKYLRSQSEESRTLYFAYAGSPLSGEELASLDVAQGIFLEAQRRSTHNGARLLLVYIPTKFRVYRDFCDFAEDSYGINWQLSDLPDRLETWCRAQGIAYLDLTAALQESAGQGELVYFPDDGHWNERGHEVVARTVARFIDLNGGLGSGMFPKLSHANE